MLLEHLPNAVSDQWVELARAGDGLPTALLGELLGLPVAMAGRAGMALEFVANGGIVTLELSSNGVGRSPLLVQGADQAALVVWLMSRPEG